MAKIVQDPELLAMSRIEAILADLDMTARWRVLAWIQDRHAAKPGGAEPVKNPCRAVPVGGPEK